MDLPNDDIVTIWRDPLSVDFPNGGSRGLYQLTLVVLFDHFDVWNLKFHYTLSSTECPINFGQFFRLGPGHDGLQSTQY